VLPSCSAIQGTGAGDYVPGDGLITELEPGDRADPVNLEGEDLDGEDVSLEDLRGKVVVINVWWSNCPPCRKEAPELVEVANATTGPDVAFVGIDVRDSSIDASKGYERTFDIPFPSIYDPRGVSLLEFRGTLTPNAIPSTLVLDRSGRVAASVLGPIPSGTTLRNVIEKVVAEDG
jgi:thiol-disulfide isomerase/thioredoxin